MSTFLETMRRKLFKEGDRVEVSLVIWDPDGSDNATVETIGGCVGKILGIPKEIYPGEQIDAIVVSFALNGMPIFKATPEYLMSYSPQEAIVDMASQRGVVVEFVNFSGVYGVYEPKIMPQELAAIRAKDRVIAHKLVKETDCYRIGRLELIPQKAEEQQAEKYDPFARWSKERIENEREKSGSRKMANKLNLGYVYIVEPNGGRQDEVVFHNKEVGKIKDGTRKFPTGYERCHARIIFISQSNVPTVELCFESDIPSGAEAQKQSNEKNIAAGRNQEVYEKGKKDNSLCRAGKYWTGYNYTVPVQAGCPYFKGGEYNGERCDNVRVEVIGSIIAYSNGDKVKAEIHHIRKDKDGPYDYIFKVKILKILGS